MTGAPSLRQVVETLSAFVGCGTAAFDRNVIAAFRDRGGVPADDRASINDVQAAALLIGAATAHIAGNAFTTAEIFGMMKPTVAAELVVIETMRALQTVGVQSKTPLVSVLGTEIRLAALPRSEAAPEARVDRIGLWVSAVGPAGFVSMRAHGLPILVGFGPAVSDEPVDARLRVSIDGAIIPQLGEIFGPGDIEPVPPELIAQCVARAELRARAA